MNAKSYMLSIMKDERKTPDACVMRVFLSIASVVYLFILRCVYFLYKTKIFTSNKAPLKVISIGNITLGGTGKTPFTIKLARQIKTMGKKPVALNRGYGDDESHLLQEKLKEIPVLTGRDRFKNAKSAYSEFGSDCAVLDDGFQHYRLKRDLDIVLIDSTSPFGNMRLFPRGILREPLERLRDADFAILTKSDMGREKVAHIREILKRLNSSIEIAESYYKPVCLKKLATGETLPLGYIAGKKVAILAGIANPGYFEWMITKIGASVSGQFFYPDHHRYDRGDIERIKRECVSKNIDTVITTEKDAVRLKCLKSLPRDIEMLALAIDFSISSGEEVLVGRLHSILNS